MSARYVFTAADAKKSLDQFEVDAKAWKPTDFDQECALRLDYYLDLQVEDTKTELKRKFPRTHSEMVPVTLPITSHFVNEQARVFLNATQLDLVNGEGQALEAKDPIADWWTKAKAAMGLALRLKQTDRYTTLHRTHFLKVGWAGDRVTLQNYFAHRVDYVPDPAYPFDLDKAYAVRLDLGGESALSTTLVAADGTQMPAVRRYEFWCARPGEGFYARVDSNGRVEEARDNPYGDIVPIVLFTAHTEELGPFVKAKQGIHLFNRALNVAATDEQHIAEAQGYGQLFLVGTGLEAQGSGVVPPEVTRGPNRMPALPAGWDVKSVSGNAPIADLLARLDAAIKRAAVLNGIPPGSVSLEARAVASGISLQIEMRPLLELRQDAIELYQGPIERLWKVIRSVHNAASKQKEIPEGTSLRWRPGDVQMPTDPHQQLDDILAKLKASPPLMSHAEALAEIRRIPLPEAEELSKKLRAEAPAPAQMVPGADPFAAARARLQTPAAQRTMPMQAQQPPEPAAAG